MIVLFLFSTEFGSVDNTHGLLFHILGTVWPGVYGLDYYGQFRIEFYLRKTAHFTEYAVFGGLLYRAYRGTGFSPLRAAVFAWMTLAGFAALDEFHQSFVPSRTASRIDVMIDSAGGAFGVLLFSLWGKRRKLGN